MTISYASVGLPMYDWPEVHSATDHLWGEILASLAARGITAPPELPHHQDYQSLWHQPDLLLAQTCGLPFVADLKDKVRLIGTPSYAIDCPTGQYYSELIVPATGGADSLKGFSGRIAVNSEMSQSGYAALLSALADANGADVGDLTIVITGSHRHSIRAVASGAADLAAIDAVSFALAKRHMKEAAGVRVIGRTEPTPGLPFITALPESDIERLQAALSEAIAALDAHTRDALLLTGFVPQTASDYDVVAQRWKQVQPIAERIAGPVPA